MRKAIQLNLLFLALPLLAQTPYLVKDINTTYSYGSQSSSPTQFAGFGNRVFFAATTDTAGAELWSTDGTSAGTSMVADIVAGTGSSSPTRMRVVNGVLLFNARDVDHGIELWATDGTSAGTHLLTDINPGPNSSQPGQSILYKNQMLFGADDGANGLELWTTDGTAAGTRMLKDLNPGSASSFPNYFVTMGDSVFFFAAGALWKTDGTSSGTIKVMTVQGVSLAVAGSTLFFEGLTAATGWELWISDGTEAGTRMLPEIFPGIKSAFDQHLPSLGFTALDSRVLFTANDGVHGRELWVSDGTATGTRMFRDFTPGAVGRWDNAFDAPIAAFDGRAFFSVSDGDHETELWSTDGTDAGTSLFADLTLDTNSAFPIGFVVSGGKLFFREGNDVFVGARIWVLDNRGVQPRRIGGPAGPGLGFIGDGLWPVNGKVYFSGFTPLNSGEPWVTDGTEAGSHMIANLAPDMAASSHPSILTAAGNLLFFNAYEGDLAATSRFQPALWRSDGTTAGTFKILETQPLGLQAAGPLVFFPAQINSTTTTLMVSDGTILGTKPADDFLRPFGQSKVGTFFPFGDELFVTVNDAFDGSSLWKTTPAANATATRLGNLNAYGMVDVAGRKFFYASAPFSPTGSSKALWTTDGSPAGTYAVIPTLNADSSALSNLANAAGTLYFQKTVRDEKPKLWKSDGTADGTVVVKELDVSPSLTTSIVAAGHRVYFAVGAALWVSDGTEAGTRELVAGPFYQFPLLEHLTPVGDRMLYTSGDEKSGIELWGTDGTPEGTKLLRNVSAGFQLANVEETVYFTANDDAHGNEIWTTDGTPEGTKLLIDLEPGAAGSNAFGFTRVGSLLYFSANSSATGRELWALPLTGSRLSISDSRIAERNTGSDTAHFTVSLAEPATQSINVDYATSDGTARANEDYDAASGTLTFAVGEIAKTIDVRVRGDALQENNETFFVTLRNVNGARVIRGEGVGIIEDYQIAGLSIAPQFLDSTSRLKDGVSVSNAGPRAASEIVVRTTSTPNDGGQRCTICSIPQLATGGSGPAAFDSSLTYEQTYISATVTARQADPLSSNNATAWTINAQRSMAMNAAYLTPGGTATVTAMISTQVPVIASSDPSVVSVPASITRVSSTVGTFTVTAIKSGTSIINVDGQFPLLITVVAPGTHPRWPGGVTATTISSTTRFDRPATIMVAPTGTAPISGAKATGTVTITAGTHELARRTIDGTASLAIPVYPPSIGPFPYTVTYSGDANFLPQTLDTTGFVVPGLVAISGGLERVAGSSGTYSLTIHATGSPVAAPTGTLVVLNGSTEVASLALGPFIAGTSVAHGTISNLPASPTLTVKYQGDALYQAGSQQVRLVESRNRATRP